MLCELCFVYRECAIVICSVGSWFLVVDVIRAYNLPTERGLARFEQSALVISRYL